MICLNMIVKNEAAIIGKCLASVIPFIDRWVIVDTGSTDGTQAIVQEALQKIPGQLYERPWVDFSHNRNEAMALAKGMGDYLLFIDADEELKFLKPVDKSKLDQDCYFTLVQEISGIQYHRELLVRSSLNWKWKGAVHEAISCPEAQKFQVLKEVVNLSATEQGQRFKDPEKYKKDAAALEKDLKNDPADPRTVFYLAMSYKNAGEFAKAVSHFERRSQMGGVEEEIFLSLLFKGNLERELGLDPQVFIKNLERAYLYRPSRAEPLFWIADYYIQNGQPLSAYLFAKEALTIPYPKDVLFVQNVIYEGLLLLLFADAAFRIGRREETKMIYQKLLKDPKLPDSLRNIIHKNLEQVFE
ncbi:MAG: glycosyltransferase [Verrucomicrobia bacterium]|nr:glycosyltransferase [Verrucomicrobiota bacterium]